MNSLLCTLTLLKGEQINENRSPQVGFQQTEDVYQFYHWDSHSTTYICRCNLVIATGQSPLQDHLVHQKNEPHSSSLCSIELCVPAVGISNGLLLGRGSSRQQTKDLNPAAVLQKPVQRFNHLGTFLLCLWILPLNCTHFPCQPVKIILLVTGH